MLSITVVPQPVCDWQQSGSDAEQLAFIKKPRIQRAIFAIGDALTPYEKFYIDTLRDPLQRRIVLVFHTDFRGYAQLQQDLARKISGVNVELAPSCRTRGQLERAEKTL